MNKIILIIASILITTLIYNPCFCYCDVGTSVQAYSQCIQNENYKNQMIQIQRQQLELQKQQMIQQQQMMYEQQRQQQMLEMQRKQMNNINYGYMY